MSIKKIIFTLLLLAVPVLFAIVTNANEGSALAIGSGPSAPGFDCDACRAALSAKDLKAKNEHCNSMPASAQCLAPTGYSTTPIDNFSTGAGQTK